MCNSSGCFSGDKVKTLTSIKVSIPKNHHKENLQKYNILKQHRILNVI